MPYHNLPPRLVERAETIILVMLRTPFDRLKDLQSKLLTLRYLDIRDYRESDERVEQAVLDNLYRFDRIVLGAPVADISTQYSCDRARLFVNSLLFVFLAIHRRKIDLAAVEEAVFDRFRFFFSDRSQPATTYRVGIALHLVALELLAEGEPTLRDSLIAERENILRNLTPRIEGETHSGIIALRSSSHYTNLSFHLLDRQKQLAVALTE